MSTQHKIHLYRLFEAIYRTQVEYIVAVTCQIWQLGILIHKKDNYVTVLTHYGIAISRNNQLYWGGIIHRNYSTNANKDITYMKTNLQEKLAAMEYWWAR